jgi:hypothetical protein
MMASVPNSRCLQILRELSERKQPDQGRTVVDGPDVGVWMQTVRKVVLAEDDRGSVLRTVRCKEGMYIAEETPALPSEICPSWDDAAREAPCQQHLDQIDAIFTELEDYLIEARANFSAKVRQEMGRGVSREERRLRCDQQLRDMRTLLHYFKQVSENFLQPSPKSTPL